VKGKTQELNGNRFPIESAGMQSLFPSMMLAVLASPQEKFERMTAFFQRDDLHWLETFYFCVILGALLLNGVWCWVASKMVIRGETATLGNAMRVWVAASFLPFAIAAWLFFFGPLVLKNLIGMDGEVIWALVGLFFLVCFLIFVLIPMKAYEIDFFHALGSVVLVVVLCVAGGWAGGYLVGKKLGVPGREAAFQDSMGRTKQERVAFSKRLSGIDAADELDRDLDNLEFPFGNPLPLEEREAAIQALQKKLESRKATLAPKDAEAAAAFQLRLARYLRVLEQIKADRKAAPKS
jgi:hypothetical protein